MKVSTNRYLIAIIYYNEIILKISKQLALVLISEVIQVSLIKLRLSRTLHKKLK